jgi:uncharacterized Zn-binding protein involved in type VI secretion
MAEASILTVGCPSDHGGQIITGDPIMKIDGKPVARVGDLHSCPLVYPTIPPIPHSVTPIIRTAKVEIRGTVNLREFAYEGDTTACGALLLKCSSNATGIAIGVAVGLGLLGLAFLFLKRNKSGITTSKKPKQKINEERAKQLADKVQGVQDFISRNLNPPETQRVVESKDSCDCPPDVTKK